MAALGGLLFGFDTAVISGTTDCLRAVYGLSNNLLGFYALCMVGQLLWVLTVMPETKGVSLERTQEELGIE